MRLERGSVGAGQGDVNKVLPGVQVAEGGGDVDGEVVPLEAVLLSDAHRDCVCVRVPRALWLNTQEICKW